MPELSVSHLFEKIHVHVACCGWTVVVNREHNNAESGKTAASSRAEAVDDDGRPFRPRKWDIVKALLRARFACCLRRQGAASLGTRSPDV